MAPILSTAVGVTPQIIDDPRLIDLLEKLNEFEPKNLIDRKHPQSADEVIALLDITKLVAVIEPYQSWIFEEQVCCGRGSCTSICGRRAYAARSFSTYFCFALG